MRQTRSIFYVLLPVLAVLFAIVVAEFALSVIYPIPFSLEKNMYYESDPYTGYRHRSLGSGNYLNGVEAVANSRGQRDDEVEIPKPTGVFRILMLGDSFTVGANVDQQVAYPQVLEQLLNEVSGGRRVEVVNTGVGGWSPFQYAQYLEYYGEQFEPDMVLLGFFVGNDTYIDSFRVEDTLTAVLGRRVSRQTGQSRWGGVQVFLYENSNIARLLMKQGFEDIRFKRENCSEFNDYFLGVQKQRMHNHSVQVTAADSAILERNVEQLDRVRSWAEQRGLPSFVFIFPDENQVNPALQDAVLTEVEKALYNFENPQRLLHPLLDASAIQWDDLLPEFRADPRCLYMNDSHWVPDGHRMVAEKMRDYLIEKSWFAWPQ